LAKDLSGPTRNLVNATTVLVHLRTAPPGFLEANIPNPHMNRSELNII